jgi:hypothetical protein
MACGGRGHSLEILLVFGMCFYTYHFNFFGFKRSALKEAAIEALSKPVIPSAYRKKVTYVGFTLEL